MKLTDLYSSQPLERSDDWRAGRSRGRLRKQVRNMEEQEGSEGELEGSSVGEQSGERLVTQGARSGGLLRDITFLDMVTRNSAPSASSLGGVQRLLQGSLLSTPTILQINRTKGWIIAPTTKIESDSGPPLNKNEQMVYC